MSNADARQTFKELVGSDHLPRGYVRKLERMTVSDSAVALYIATCLDLDAMGLTTETLICPGSEPSEKLSILRKSCTSSRRPPIESASCGSCRTASRARGQGVELLERVKVRIGADADRDRARDAVRDLL